MSPVTAPIITPFGGVMTPAAGHERLVSARDRELRAARAPAVPAHRLLLQRIPDDERVSAVPRELAWRMFVPPPPPADAGPRRPAGGTAASSGRRRLKL